MIDLCLVYRLLTGICPYGMHGMSALQLWHQLSEILSQKPQVNNSWPMCCKQPARQIPIQLYNSMRAIHCCYPDQTCQPWCQMCLDHAPLVQGSNNDAPLNQRSDNPGKSTFAAALGFRRLVKHFGGSAVLHRECLALQTGKS